LKIYNLTTTPKFITACNAAVAIVTLIMMIVRYSSNDPFMAKASIALSCFLTTSSILMILLKQNYQVGAISIFVIAALLQPLRVYLTGGIYSFGFVWLVPLILAVFWTSGVKFAILTALFQTIAVTFMVTQLPSPTEIEFFTSTHLARSLTMLFAPILSMVMFSVFAGHEQKKFLEISKETEKSTLDTLGITMAHEINSPLMALMGSVDRVEKKYNLDEDDKKAIGHAIKEIRNRLDLIEKLGDGEIHKEKYTSSSKNDIFLLNKDKKDFN